MTIEGVDFAFNPHPSVASLVAAGKKFVCRYLSHDASKNITLPELLVYKAHGIAVVLNWESTGTDTGFANGAADARAAQAQAVALGESTSPIIFSMDFDPRGRTAEIVSYMQGVVSVIGKNRAGLYSGYAGIKAYFDAGIGRYGWQTYAWSGGAWDNRAQLQQYSNGHVIGGAQVDLDRAVALDYGQIGVNPVPPTPPPPTPPTLSLGSTGGAVRTLQARLNAWHYNVVIDGVFGPLTLAAVKSFQTSHALTVDGIVGPRTWLALDAVPKPPVPPPSPPVKLTTVTVELDAPIGPGVKAEGTGVVSLNRVAQLRGTTPLHLIVQTLHSGTPAEVEAFANYLGSTPMPQHLVYYTTNP